MDRRIHEGMKVRAPDGSKLGKIVHCGEETFVVEKGFLFHKDQLARYDQIGDVRRDEVWLREQGDLMSGRPGVGETTATGTSGTISSGPGSTRNPGSMGFRDEDSERYVPPVRNVPPLQQRPEDRDRRR